MAVLSRDQILNDPVGPTLRAMTMPMIVGILVMFSFQAVDTWFIAQLGTEQLAAISFTLPVGFIVNNVAIGLSIGASVMIARLIGGEEMQSARTAASRVVILAAILGLVLAICGLLGMELIFTALGADADMISLIREYMEVWIFGILFIVPGIVGNGIVRATGDTRWPSYMMMLAGVVNIVLDPLLIFGLGPFPRMELRGAAIATLASLVFSSVAMIWILMFRERLVSLANAGGSGWKVFTRQLARLAIPAALANVLAPLANAILTRYVAEHGQAAVAAFGAGGRFEQFAMVVAFAITAALSPFMAQNLGAGRVERARTGLFVCLRFILFYQLGIMALVLITRYFLGQVFSSDPAVIELTQLYLLLMPCTWLAYGLFVIINTAFNAAGKTDRALLASALRTLLFIGPGAWAGNQIAGLTGIYMGAIAGGLLAVCFSWWYINKSYDQIINRPAV